MTHTKARPKTASHGLQGKPLSTSGIINDGHKAQVLGTLTLRLTIQIRARRPLYIKLGGRVVPTESVSETSFALILIKISNF